MVPKTGNVLFTCIGRRVSLLRAFRQAARRLRRPVTFLGTDTTDTSPALQCCDRGFLVSPTDDPAYLDQLERIVRAHGVDLLIPTVDLDLLVLAQARQRFAALGCQILVSSPYVVDTCQDKRKTARFLAQQGFAVPVTVSTQRMLQQTGGPKLSWPCYVKPWNGSAGRNHAIVRNREELRFFAQRIPHAICQEYLVGTEYTCDVYVDRKRTVRCVVPRQRLEVRSGEVSKARIVKDSGLMAEVATLATRLGAGPGVITVQVIVTSARRRVFIEINPRLGGGIPLAIQAGADMPYWLLAEMVGKQPRIRMDGFKNGLLMLRYDDEIWIPGKTL